MFEIACTYFWCHQCGSKAPGGWWGTLRVMGHWMGGFTAGPVSHGVHRLLTLLGARGSWGCLGRAVGKGGAGRGERGCVWLTVSPSQPKRPLLSHPSWAPLAFGVWWGEL